MSQGCKDSVNELKPTREDKKPMNSNLEQVKDKKKNPKRAAKVGNHNFTCTGGHLSNYEILNVFQKLFSPLTSLALIWF